MMVRVALSLVLAWCCNVMGVTLDSAYVEQLRRGIAFTMTEQFDSARAVFQTLEVRDSLDHAARLYLAGVDHAEMVDREDYAGMEKFNQSAEEAIMLANISLDHGDDSAWAYLTIGNAQAYMASLEAKAGSWWTAMRRGVKAKGAYLNALEKNPTLYDAYLGLGTYHFWKSAKTEFINWLPLVADRKDEGIDELKLAADSSLFSNDLALNSLVWVYLQQERADEALGCAERLYQKYPYSRLITWGMAFSCYAAGRFHEALKYFGEIIESLEGDTTQNFFNLIECRYHRGMIFKTMGDNSAATNEFNKLTDYPVPSAVASRQKDKLRDANAHIEKTQARRSSEE